MNEPTYPAISMRPVGRWHRVIAGPAFALCLSAAANAATLSVSHHFDNGAGAYYTGQLAQGRDGNLYGTIPSGGAHHYGTAFKLTPGGTFTKLHDFNYDADGIYPFGGLTLGTDGNFYGTTQQAGLGNGTIFRMTPAGVITTLYRFNNFRGGGGSYPVAAPIQGRDGNLYGTTSAGPPDISRGVVYKITPDGAFSTLFDFSYRNPLDPQGKWPTAPLIQGTDGALYGTAREGGDNPYDRGTVFKVTTAGVASTVYNFDWVHGAWPEGPVLQAPDGNLYGTTRLGGTTGYGVIFKLTLKGAITVLYNFDGISAAGRAKGYTPYAGLVRGSDGSFYGATYEGGASGNGALFKITSGGSYTVQASFDGSNGAHPSTTPLLHTNGRIYGMTQHGGASNYGTLYRLDVGAPGFIAPIPNAAKAGTSIGLLGAMAGTTAVSFNGVNASFSSTGNTYRTAVVPAGAATGIVKVTTPTGTPQSLKAFQQLSTLTAFSPASGAVGSAVILTGTGLSQTTAVKFGGSKVASFVVNSPTQVTATVPVGAITGKISVTTKGATVSTATVFTVTP